MIAMWGDVRPEQAMAIALYQNYHDCYMDLIVQHPENRRPGMLVMHERRRLAEEAEEAKKTEERMRREASFEREKIEQERRATEELGGGVWAPPADETPLPDFSVSSKTSRRSESSEASPERPPKGRRKGSEATEEGDRRAEASTQMEVDEAEPSARDEPSVAPPAVPVIAEQAAARDDDERA